MWEFTSPEGLNYAIDESDPSKIVRVVSADEPTGERCERYGFDVGQSNGNPPIHPFHKDIGLGRVNRIVGFKSLNELSIDVEFKGSSGIIDFDGRGPTLKVRYFPGRAAGRVRHFLEGGGRAAELRPDHVYEIDPSLQSISETPATNERPESDFSTAEALRQCVYGNTVRSPCGKLYIPVNRAWIRMIGRMFGCDESFSGPLVFVWDAAFNSIIAARVNPELAASNLRLLMEQLESNGCLRQFRVGDKLNNLVGLPIVSLAVWKLYEATREKGYLKEFYEPLRRFNTWLETNRDKNGDGLLEWGYEENGRNMELKGRYAPWYESGIDDSPMWEGEPVDENLRCFAASAICLNSVYALDCMILADMAQVLEREDEKATYLGKHAAMASRVNSTLWDERRKLYANRRWSGEFSEEISPTSFYPLLARIPDHGRASALIAHLHDEREFGGEFMLPSIWRRSRHFTADGDYWRGRIWPPMSYLVMEGLKNYDPVSYSVLREKSLRMFRQEWIDHGHIHENYRSDTGYGETRGKYYRSSPFYTWGGLLALQA